jgi:anti-anti-sigma factor
VDVENETQPIGAHKAAATNNGLRSPPPPPPFTAMTRLEGNTAVVMFHGELDVASIAVLVSSLVGIAFVVEELMLDFSELEFIDACGLRTIASTVQQVRAYGGSVSIRSPNPTIERLLDLVDFKQIVEIQPQAFL